MLSEPLRSPFVLNALSSAFQALGGFDPLSFFANNEQGAWYDPSDWSTIFQDSAGTAPVTSVTNPVGRQLDKSGRTNHLSQATAASRPIYNMEGGVRYLTFDGVDDGLITGPITLGADMDCFMAVRRNSAAGAVAFYDGTSFFLQFATGAGIGSSGAGTPTFAVNGVDVPGGTTTSALQLHTATPVGSWVVVECRNLNLASWWSFRISTATGYRLNGDIGGIILCPAQSDANRTKARKYLGNKVGLSL